VASSVVAMFDLFIYTSYVNVQLSNDKLDRTNYGIWAFGIKLWLESHGYVDHFIQSVVNVVENEISC